MSRARLFVVAVAALTVLFFLGIGAGAVRGGGDAGGLPPGRDLFERLKRGLTANDLDGPCLDRSRRELAVAAGQTCLVTVSASWYPVRRLTLRLKTGTSASVTLDQKGSVADKRTLTAGAPVGLDVFNEPATVLLACPSGCVVEVR